jgi:hypothetical protein
MKKEITFIASMIILGIAFSIWAVAIHVAILAPIEYLIMTQAEKADYELMSLRFDWIENNLEVIYGIVILFIVTACILLLANLNPNFKNKYKGKTAKLKLSAVLLCSLVCFLFLLIPPTSFYSSMYSAPQPLDNTTAFVFFFFGMGLLWFIAGETGWAGDFSSWKMGVQGKKAKPFLSFILGGITGIAAFGLYYLFKWSFYKYSWLVLEVLGESSEVSYPVFKLLAYELMFTSSVSLGILSGFAISLSPTYKTAAQRLTRLIFPAILLAILIPVILITYNNAVTKYDLGKKSLAEAVGVPEKASLSKAIVLFLPDRAVLQEWPMQTKGSSFFGTYAIELSYENLKKVEDYIAEHKNGSVYNYVARDALIRGYFGLWDVKNAVEQLFKNSEEINFFRLILISELRYLPVTQGNLNCLKSFSDEGKWYIGSRVMLMIAEAFMHFGLVDEAKAWVEKAKAKGEDVSKITFLNDRSLTDGKITGLIKVNGKPPANTKIALLRYTEGFAKIVDGSFPNRLIDARELDSSGKFAFDKLGKGNYTLAIMTDKETIPYDLPKDKLNVNTYSAGMRLGADNPVVNLGDINIVIVK